MKVLVTGASGFVGKAVCRRLFTVGHKVRAGVRDPAIKTASAALPWTTECVDIGDLGESSNLSTASREVDCVVHLAARLDCERNKAAALERLRAVNVEGTCKLLRAAADQGVRRFVYISSAKVNGESSDGHAFTEADAVRPQDPYAISKWEAEQQVQELAAHSEIDVVILRPPLVYGPGVRGNFSKLIKLVQSRMPLPCTTVDRRRSLIGLENLADVIVRCVDHPGAAGQCFLVRDAEDVSVRQMIESIGSFLDCPVRLLPLPEALLRAAARVLGKSEVANRLLGSFEIDSSKCRRMLDWFPPVPFQDGLEATLRWYAASAVESQSGPGTP